EYLMKQSAKDQAAADVRAQLSPHLDELKSARDADYKSTELALVEKTGQLVNSLLSKHPDLALSRMRLDAKQRLDPARGKAYLEKLRGEAKAITDDAPAVVLAVADLNSKMTGGPNPVTGAYRKPITPAEVGEHVNDILHEHEKEHVHLTPTIPF